MLSFERKNNFILKQTFTALHFSHKVNLVIPSKLL